MTTEEAIKILEDMKVNFPVPKAAVTQIKRNIALDRAIDVLSNCSEIPNDWIPCTKKKHPDKDMFCHVTVIDYDGDYIVDDDDWDVDSESWDEYSDDEIIAWMPEIQPYQPKEDES